MTDPQRAPGKTPPRAEPLQPDRPGQGLAREDQGDAADAGADDSQSGARKREEQSDAARENVRGDYH